MKFSISSYLENEKRQSSYAMKHAKEWFNDFKDEGIDLRSYVIGNDGKDEASRLEKIEYILSGSGIYMRYKISDAGIKGIRVRVVLIEETGYVYLDDEELDNLLAENGYGDGDLPDPKSESESESESEDTDPVMASL
jgi:hypothetical protein